MWFALGTTLWEPWVLRVHFLPYAFNPGKVPYHRRMFFLKMPLPHALRDWELCWGGEILRRKFWETLGQSADKGLLQVRTRLPWWLNGGGSTVKNSPAKQEIGVQSLGQEDPLEKKVATHSSILVWEIPWTEEPGGLQSTGSQKRWTRLSD